MSQSMKAAVLYAPGDLRVEMAPIPEIQADQALIKVNSTGICGSDLDRILKNGTYSFPMIPGHEFSGHIEQIQDHPTFKDGDPVVVAPLMPCEHCENCQRGLFGQCTGYLFMGSRNDGAFAEYIRVPIKNLIPFPADVPLAYGALVEPAAVTLHGLLKVQIHSGDTVAVLGCGTIGLFAVALAKLAGATKIIAVDLDEEKLDVAKKVGATQVLNSRTGDSTNALVQQGIDVSIETAGVPFTQVQAIDIVKPDGRVLLLGTAHQDVVFPAATFERILRQELTVVGSWNSYSAPFPGREWLAIIQYIETGALNMEDFITHRITLEELDDMLRKMAKRELFFNKVLVELEK